MKPNLIWNRLLPSWERVGLCWLLLCLAPVVVAQEPPNFARVQALAKTLNPVIAADHDGGCLVAIRFYGTNLQFLGATALPVQTNTPDSQVIVAKLDRAGNAQWLSEIRGNYSFIIPQAILRDRESNVVFLAYATESTSPSLLTISGTNFFALTNAITAPTSFLVKWSPQGHLISAKQVGRLDGPISVGTGLAVDSTNSLYVIGSCNEGTNITRLAAKFDAEGNLLWQVPELGNRAIATSLVVDGQDALYVSGVFSTNVVIGGVLLTNAPPNQFAVQSFVAKFDRTGAVEWVRQTATNNSTYIRALALDSTGHLIATGDSASSNLFGLPVNRGPDPQFYSSTSPMELFVAKLNSSGQPVWARQMEPASGSPEASSVGFALAVDALGCVYAGGALQQAWTNGSVRIGGSQVPQRGLMDALLLKLDASGNPHWALRMGNVADDSPTREMVSGLAITPDGLLAIGHFMATNATFGALTVVTGAVITTPYRHVDACTFLALIPHPAPPLATELTGAELKVSWPTFPPEFELETATALGTPTLWSSNSVPVSTSNGTHSVTFPVDGPARYFRLRKPIP